MGKLKEIFTKKMNLVLLLITPIFLLMFMHCIEIGKISSLFDFIGNNFGAFVFSYLIILLAILFVSAIFNSTSIASITINAIVLILSWVSNIKCLETGEVLTVFDFNFGKEVGEIAQLLKPSTFLDKTILLNAAMIIITTIFIVLLRKKKIKFNLITRIIIILIVPLLIFASLFTKTGRQFVLGNVGNGVTVSTAINTMHEKKGLISALYLEYAIQKEESNTIEELYDKKKIYSILDEVKETKTANFDTKPNVIIVMSEAFFDVTELKDVEFSADPIPNIRSLMSNYTSGTSVSGSYGKNTSNIEFELFTGNTLKFLSAGLLPYRDEVEMFDRDLATMQKEFKNAGYSTIALHTWDADFYNRDVVYPKLGFDEFYSREDFKDAPLGSKFISDEFLMEQVIKQCEEVEGPKFIFALTMQNHYPYSSEYYTEESPVKVETSKLTSANLEKLQSYVHNLCDVDASMKKLIDYLENQDEPTIVLFYGDHYPLMTNVYLQLEHINDLEPELVGEELYKMRKIPFFIYDNFNYKKEYPKLNNTMWSRLGSFLLSYAGIDKSIYYDFVDNLTYKVMYDRIFIDENDVIYNEPTYKYSKEIEDYKLLQYDMLYGEQYIKEWEKEQK